MGAVGRDEQLSEYACPEGTDPRVARSRVAIIDATTELLLEGGIDDLSVDAIAERAGVSKATIYRHWATRQHLIMDALAAMKRSVEPPDTGALRSDLLTLLHGVAEHLGSPAGSVYCTLSGAAEHDAELAEMRREFAAERGNVMRTILARGIERGELPADADVELIIGRLVGPLFYMRMARGELAPDHWPEALVDAALAAAPVP
jgi:AcrR family transcriptional regulator